MEGKQLAFRLVLLPPVGIVGIQCAQNVIVCL
jgi:hypothetical protein